jgi:hypothetical protein
MHSVVKNTLMARGLTDPNPKISSNFSQRCAMCDEDKEIERKGEQFTRRHGPPCSRKQEEHLGGA